MAGKRQAQKLPGKSLTFLTRMPADKLNDTLPTPAHIHLLPARHLLDGHFIRP